MFEGLSSFFGSVGSFFSNTARSVYNSVSNGVNTVYTKITGTTSDVVKTVYTDIKGGITETGHIIEKGLDNGRAAVTDVIHTAKDVLQHGQDTVGNTIGSLGSSLSFPLVLAGGAAALYFLKK